jgi:hypothetical protein
MRNVAHHDLVRGISAVGFLNTLLETVSFRSTGLLVMILPELHRAILRADPWFAQKRGCSAPPDTGCWSFDSAGRGAAGRLAIFLAVRSAIIPKAFGQYGHYRPGALDLVRSGPSLSPGRIPA